MGPFCLLVMIAFLESISRENLGSFGWTCQRIFRELRCVLSSKELEQQTQYNVYHQYQKEKKNYRNLTQRNKHKRKNLVMFQKQKQKQIKPSRLAGSKQKDTVQKALQNKRKRLMPELTDYPMLRKQNKSEKLFFLLIISSLYTIHIQLELKI